jgi:predicted NAD-dependent protein-ADP-ribosyltransferase YbiA (DUF1768 family)
MAITQEIINVGGNHESYRERELSNFSPHSFYLRGFDLANVEAFVQGIKHPEDESSRYEIFKMTARDAKRTSPRVSPDVIVWEGQAMRYRSLEHYRLQAAAIFAKFDQNEDALEALLATGQLPLIHDLGHPEKPTTCLPTVIFTQILEEARSYFFKEIGVTNPSLIGASAPTLIVPYTIEYSRS